MYEVPLKERNSMLAAVEGSCWGKWLQNSSENATGEPSKVAHDSVPPPVVVLPMGMNEAVDGGLEGRSAAAVVTNVSAGLVSVPRSLRSGAV